MDGIASSRRLVAAAVLAASAVVAFAATDTGLIQPAAEWDQGLVRGIRWAGGLLAATGLAVLLLQRRALRWDKKRDPDPTGNAMRTAVITMAFVALFASLGPRIDTGASAPGATALPSGGRVNNELPGASDAPPTGATGRAERPPTVVDQVAPPPPATQPAQRPQAPPESTSSPGPMELPGRTAFLLLILALAVVGALLLRVALVRDQEEDGVLPQAPAAVDEAEAGLEASLGEVAFDGHSPRHQITAAYSRLLTALVDAGAPRKSHEAPHEHLHRILEPLGVHPEPLHRLTALYVIAQFSERTITEEHRIQAAEALEQSLGDLRSASAVHGHGKVGA